MMNAPRARSGQKLPSGDALMKHVQDGLSNKQIGMMYGTTPEAVRMALAKLGVKNGPGKNDHSHYLPWRLRADHVSDPLARRLRSYSRRQQGMELTAGDARLLDEWITFMEGGNPWKVKLSVHYDRLDPDGFWLEPEKPGDRDYISPPSEAAE